MVHVARPRRFADGVEGVEFRSCFWLGKDAEKLGSGRLAPKWLFDRLANSGFVKRRLVEDSSGSSLLRHCFEEYRCLASVLPALFEQEAAEHWHGASLASR